MSEADTQNTDTDIYQTSKRTSKTNLQKADSNAQNTSKQSEEYAVKTTPKHPSDEVKTNTQQQEQNQQEEQIILPRRSTHTRKPPKRFNPTFSVFHTSVSQTRKSECNHFFNNACSVVMLLLCFLSF